VLIPTPDGRELQVVDAGGDGLPCLFHSGTPAGAVVSESTLRAAADAGLRWITYARPGYGDSTPFPDRTVAQAARDSETVLDHLGVGRFVTYGWSGGGPHALACAALLAPRCLAATTIAGVAPYDAADLDFVAGMAPENLEEYALALRGREALMPYLLEQWPGLREVTAADVAASFGGLICAADRDSLTDEFAEFVAASFRDAVRVGVNGWLDDDLATTAPWGFSVESITVPVAVWQGGEDLMVPFSHGEWLVAHVPGARAHLLPEQGHLSLAVVHLPEILQELHEMARTA
jgi:pimeloyl-ACP methyl ester carboxylesterase